MKMKRLLSTRFSLLLGLLLLAGCGGASAIPVRTPHPSCPTPTSSQAPLPTTIYVANRDAGNILEFPIDATGNISPSATIGGTNTLLVDPVALAVDKSGLVYTENDTGTDIMEFNATGNVAPSNQIVGSRTGLGPSEGVAVDLANGTIYVTSFRANSVTGFAAGATGNQAFASQLVGASTTLNAPLGITAFGCNYVANSSGNSILGWPQSATGNRTPATNLSGPNTGLLTPYAVAFDGTGNMYVLNHSNPSTITVYAAPYSGDAAPLRTIAGSNTMLTLFSIFLTVDSSGKIYVTTAGTANSVLIFGANANGNVAPIATIAGGSTGLNAPTGIAVH